MPTYAKQTLPVGAPVRKGIDPTLPCALMLLQGCCAVKTGGFGILGWIRASSDYSGRSLVIPMPTVVRLVVSLPASFQFPAAYDTDLCITHLSPLSAPLLALDEGHR